MNRRPLAILFVVIFIDLLGFGMIIPLMPRYARELGAPEAFIGLLSSGYSAMQFLFAPIWGRLSDRIGRRPVLVASLFMSSVAFCAYGFSNTFVALLATRLFAGVATANIPIAQAYVADVTEPKDRARGMGILGAALGLGFVLGPVLGGLLSEVSLGAPAFVAAALCLINGTAAFFVLPEPARKIKTEPQLRRLAALKKALLRPGVARLLLCYFLTIFAFSAMESTFSLLAADRFRITDREIGYVFAFIGAIMIVVQVVIVGPMSRRFGEVAMLCVGTALMTGGLAMLPFAPGVVGLVLACVPLSVGHGLLQPAVTSLLSRSASADTQGGSLGIGQSVAAFGRILGPETGTYAFHAARAAPYLGGAAVMFLATIVSITLRSAPVARDS